MMSRSKARAGAHSTPKENRPVQPVATTTSWRGGLGAPLLQAHRPIRDDREIPEIRGVVTDDPKARVGAV
jgi:hypothetical protein